VAIRAAGRGGYSTPGRYVRTAEGRHKHPLAQQGNLVLPSAPALLLLLDCAEPTSLLHRKPLPVKAPQAVGQHLGTLKVSCNSRSSQPSELIPFLVTAAVAGAGGCQGTAWQRFLPTGPLALLPIRDGLASVVWSAPSDVAQDLEKLGPEEFAAAINKVSGGTVGGVAGCTPACCAGSLIPHT
jgi:hypothetical protein